MSKGFVNYKKANKLLFCKDVEISIVKGVVFINDEPISPKTAHIFVSGDLKISAAAASVLAHARVKLTFKYKNAYPASMCSGAGSAKMKRLQAKACLSRTAAMRLTKARDKIGVLMGLPPLNIDQDNVLLSEAVYMKRVYAKLSKEVGVEWRGKAITGSQTALHSWWYLLYAEVSSCVYKMGLDPDLGFIHRCNNGFVYDVADVLKPFFLKEALRNKPFNPAVFWQIFSERRIRKLLPSLILYVLKEKDFLYFSRRLRLCRESSRTDRRPTHAP